MANNIPQLRTPGVMAAELDAPLSRVLYVLRTRSHLIKPIGRAAAYDCMTGQQWRWCATCFATWTKNGLREARAMPLASRLRKGAPMSVEPAVKLHTPSPETPASDSGPRVMSLRPQQSANG